MATMDLSLVGEGLFTWPDEVPQLIGSRCQAVRRWSFPQQDSCPRCTSTDVVRHLLSRTGTLWTWTVQGFRPKSPPYEGPVEFEPYPVGYVELPGELKVETLLVDVDPEDLRIGMDMELAIVPFAPSATEDPLVTFAFRPIGAPDGGDTAVERRIDAYLVCAGKYHDFDFARLELLKLLAEDDHIRVQVAQDFGDVDAIRASDFLVTYTCDLRPSLEQQQAIRSWVEGGGRWLALHGTNCALDPPSGTSAACTPRRERFRRGPRRSAASSSRTRRSSRTRTPITRCRRRPAGRRHRAVRDGTTRSST